MRCIFFGSLFLLFLSSCHADKDDSVHVFRYNESVGIATLDPAFAKNQSIMWPVHQLFNTLVEADDSFSIKPSLAKSWEFEDDQMSITFHLRADVLFHDDPAFPSGKGRRMTASDVVFSFQRLMDKKTASPGAWIFNGRVDTLQPFLAINDSTFRLKLLRPFRPMLGVLTMSYCSILAPEVVKAYGPDIRRHPVGTGPFCMLAWEEGQALLLKRNPHYFETDAEGNSLPYLSGIKITFNESKATEFLEFRQGKIDFINDVDPSFKDELLTRKGNLRKEWSAKVNLRKCPYMNVEYLGILYDSTLPASQKSPLRFEALRKAMNHAIDRNKLVFYLRNSIGTAAHFGFVPPMLLKGDSPTRGYEYDPEKSKRLLLSAGIDPGALKPLKLVTVPSYANLGTFVATELSQAGIPVEVEVVQKSLLLDRMAAAGYPFFRGSWIADYPDAENFLSVFYGKNPAPPNYTRFHDNEFDAWYESAVKETNDSIRYALYHKMDRLIMDRAPVIPLWYDMVIHLSAKNLSGFHPNAANMLELRRVRKS